MTTALKPNPAWRGDPTFLPDVLRAFGVEFRELPGWLYWGMGDFHIIQGVMWHHTGAMNTSAGYIARNAGLSGALSSQFHTDPDGLQTLCGVGIAWHAGAGSYPGWRTDMANWDAIGFEMQHNGTDPWPEDQLESTRRATAAILWFLGKRATTLTMLSHWEYSLARQGKWDPGSGKGFAPRWKNDKDAMMDMNVQRAKVNELIDRFNRYGTLDPVPLEGLFMSLPKERQEDLARKIDTIYDVLTSTSPSRSAFAVNDAEFSVPFLIREMDGRVHEDSVLNAAARSGLTPKQVVAQLREGKTFAQIEGKE